MSVWLSTREYAVGDISPAGGLIFYENPHYAADGWRYLEAAPFDQSAGAKWGCFRTAIPGVVRDFGAGSIDLLHLRDGAIKRLIHLSGVLRRLLHELRHLPRALRVVAGI
jgi:hypothetical protein